MNGASGEEAAGTRQLQERCRKGDKADAIPTARPDQSPHLHGRLILAIALCALPFAVNADPDDCLSAPNSPAPAGEHWYYHTDWAKHRNCWYLRSISARQTHARPTSEVAPAGHPAFTKPPASAVATVSIADQVKKAKEMITAKLGNPASIKFPDIAPGKAIDSVCGETEVKGTSGEAIEIPFVVQKNEIYVINGSDDLRASRAIHKMCD